MAIGSKRLVVGAHYGVRDWIVQRLTAVILTVYVVLVAVRLVGAAGPEGALGYEEWAGIFAPAWMKVVTYVAFLGLAYHAWIGMRDVWMDYVRATGVRLVLLLLTILWLIYCAVWAAQILWSV